MAEEKAKGDVAALLALSLPDDADAIAALAPPEESPLESAFAEELKSVTWHFRGLWDHLLSKEPWRPEGSSLSADADLEGFESGYWTVLHMVGAYYGYGLIRLAAEIGANAAPLLRRPPVRPSAEAKGAPDEEDRFRRLQAETALGCFNVCVLGLIVAGKVDELGFQPGELTERFDADSMALISLSSLRERIDGHRGELAVLSQYLFGLCLDFRRQRVADRASQRREALQASASYVNPRELTLLAKRHPLMAQKYEAKRIERVFEKRLALVFESFGFTVVGARPGSVGADLLCIARLQRFAFLVDAKSTGKPYALPKADQRALRDYVEEFSRELPDLPPLEFVLLVGNEAAGTVADKLEELERSARVPVRFVPAQVIADMREQLAGPLVPEKFRDAVMKGGPVLDEELLRSSKQAVEKVVSTYSSFVEGLKEAAAS